MKSTKKSKTSKTSKPKTTKKTVTAKPAKVAKKTPAKVAAKTVTKAPVKTKAPAPTPKLSTIAKPEVVVTAPVQPILSKMSRKKLEEFRNILIGKKNELIQEAVQTVGDLTEVQEVLPDMTDQASAEMDRNFMLRIKDRERKLIFKINEVIKRIDDGTYGVCEICGDMITEQRLKARPETTQCIECKTDMEEQERRASI